MSPSLPDQFWPDHPRMSVIANDYFSMPVDILLTHLRNQGIYANAEDRMTPEFVISVMEKELAAGRTFREEPLRRH